MFFIEYGFYWFNFSTRLRQISDHLILNTCSKNLIHFSRKLAHYQEIESGSMEFILDFPSSLDFSEKTKQRTQCNGNIPFY